jgi:hypothetical protein
MKKASFLFALVLISALTFSSCFSLLLGTASKKTFKVNVSELPANESAIILFDNAGSATILLKKWNNNDISDSLYGKGYIDDNDRAEFTVPPGDNSFTFDIFFQFGNTTYEKRNIELQYNLAAETRYTVKPRTNTIKTGALTSQREFFIGIYLEEEKNEPLKEWKLGES